MWPFSWYLHYRSVKAHLSKTKAEDPLWSLSVQISTITDERRATRFQWQWQPLARPRLPNLINRYFLRTLRNFDAIHRTVTKGTKHLFPPNHRGQQIFTFSYKHVPAWLSVHWKSFWPPTPALLVIHAAKRTNTSTPNQQWAQATPMVTSFNWRMAGITWSRRE